MRSAVSLRTMVAVAFFAFAAVAYFDPALFAFAHARAQQGLIWLTLSFLATGCAAKFTVPLSLWGWRASLSTPLFLPLAAPYLLRFLIWRAVAERLNAWLFPSPSLAGPEPKAVAHATPYALPARVSTALQAAARARR